jgi:hypothetical protein
MIDEGRVSVRFVLRRIQRVSFSSSSKLGSSFKLQASPAGLKDSSRNQVAFVITKTSTVHHGGVH